MTKKHFISLANRIIWANTMTGTKFSDENIRVLAAWCAEQNPRFDRDRWLGYIRGTNGPSGGRVMRVKGECQATADAAVAVRDALSKS